MSEIIRHVLSVLPAFVLACLVVVALLCATLIALGLDLAAATR